jgi:tetratricopeptide (TPR) repeat protein
MVRAQLTSAATPLQGFASLLVKLHNLIADGNGDGEEADRLRDLMDTPWYGLSDNDTELARQISRDLYSLDLSSSERHPSFEVFTQSLANDLATARQRGNWLQALKLIESRGQEIGMSRATMLRGSCYEHLGLTDVALLFFERAVALSVSPSGALIYLLLSLKRHGRGPEAAKRARSILKQGVNDLELHRLSAIVILGEARDDPGGVSADGVLEAQAELEKVRHGLETTNEVTTIRTVQSLVECYFSLAECAYLLGDSAKAISQLTHGLRISPEDEPSLILRGLLTLENFPLARSDFQKAVQVGTEDPWPYYYLTHDSFRAEQYDKSFRYAHEGLKRTQKQEVASEFHELLAMSLYMISKDSNRVPTDDIRRHFSIAMAQSPLNVHASVNAHRFESFTLDRNEPVWDVPKPWDLRAIDMPRSLLARFDTELLITN